LNSANHDAVISIREFHFPEDYEQAFLLWQHAGEGIGVGPSDQPAEIEKKVRRDPDLFLVAEEAGQVVGTVIGGFDGRRGMVYHLAVAGTYRRQGLASKLMAEIEQRLRAKGCHKAYLLVKKGNQAAYSFYSECGWDEMDQVDIYGKVL
jgi:ribosomal protein S18 acetylase RimI-like enzyme